MPTILITEANEGFGLQLAMQYLANGWHVIAASSTPLDTSLTETSGGRIRTVIYDPLDDDSASRLVEQLDGRAIDVVFINEGVPDTDRLRPEAITPKHWRPIMLANTFAPLHLAGLLEPNLRKGERKILAAASSYVASLSNFKEPGRFAYRASKSALNQMWRNLSVEWKHWGCITLLFELDHHDKALVGDPDREMSAHGVQSFIETANSEHSGRYWTWHGTEILW
ncbi:NAD(P)-dependent dehydrogenase (short-subunit alcohol dehydrogenase family) [Rhizobium sp. BK529]|uniref:SDR family NAD(P)-dependent oxidoreductase n=1 Tax=Rhizobium sp. BK529 TaxID=2586983 RepID=UPI00160DE269|nr:SDR family NAD(P)-dependent oxidoreductase [Rhizobium sp. BK529]MBB3594894.1 NAD(P)-dependent dehydrogenase (short-subunit alcohol dehydrogenase family) [Rhizobium sp. BK529]